MRMTDIPFGTTDWSAVETTTHKGEVGMATWRTRQFGGIRLGSVCLCLSHFFALTLWWNT